MLDYNLSQRQLTKTAEGILSFLLGNFRQTASVVGAVSLVSEPLFDLFQRNTFLVWNQLHCE
jgi:hypothetical protein